MNAIAESGELLVIRHAITNMAGTLCGHSDPPLNATGLQQATTLARMLEDIPVESIYASDLQRASQTAQPLAASKGLPVSMRKDLREISFGEWEGRHWSLLAAQVPSLTTMESSPAFCAPGGEAYGVFRNRVLGAVAGIAAAHPRSITAVVTHLGVLRAVLSEARNPNGLWSHQSKIGYCSMFRLRMQGDAIELLEAIL